MLMVNKQLPFFAWEYGYLHIEDRMNTQRHNSINPCRKRLGMLTT